MYLSQKQFEILSIIAKGNTDGGKVDMDELLVACSYEPTKESMQFSIRGMIEKGAIVKAGRELRRGRSRIVFEATDNGKSVLGIGRKPLFIESSGNYELEDVFGDEEIGPI